MCSSALETASLAVCYSARMIPFKPSKIIVSFLTLFVKQS